MCRINNHPIWTRTRAGVTLIELMIALSILAFMTTALAALAQATRIASAFNEGVSTAVQHARVAQERISLAVADGYANENFPGAVVFRASIGLYTYPDTLVVWHPANAPADPGGLPRFNEIIVFTYNPSVPGQLLEITAPSDSRTVPAVANLTAWSGELTNLKTGTLSQKVMITDLLRTARPTSSSAARGVISFAVDLHPSTTEWGSYKAGDTAFTDVPWVQTIYGTGSGLCQTQVRSELQLMPGYNAVPDTTGVIELGFFGSATMNWTLRP
jgi:prepilin-type N-terminal cleavage/methylation domain-containing protein